MFIGAINTDLRAVLAELAPAWKTRPIYIGCSGNFTIERILHSQGVGPVHSNDVSLYSSAMGHHLAGRPFRLAIRDERFRWMEKYLDPGIPTLASLLLCTASLDFFDRTTPYHERMKKAYLARWDALHAETVQRVTKATEGLSIASYYGGDVVEFMQSAPAEAVVICFPPTYQGGYERLYRKLQSTFDWDEPRYELFTAERFQTLIEAMSRKETWVLSRDHQIESFAGTEIARVQTSHRAKPVWIYSNQRTSRITIPRTKTEYLPWPPLQTVQDGELAIVPITGPQLNTLRSEYLSSHIVPASVRMAYACLWSGQLIGAFGFNNFIDRWSDAYMTTDLAIISPVPRLSKLVLAAVLSKELQAALEAKEAKRIRTIGTTAFTTKPVSMKYRGLFALHNRGKGLLNYTGEAGKWTLRQALDWWQRTQQKAG